MLPGGGSLCTGGCATNARDDDVVHKALVGLPVVGIDEAVRGGEGLLAQPSAHKEGGGA